MSLGSLRVFSTCPLLADHRCLTEEAVKPVGLVDETAINVIRLRRQVLHCLQILGLRLGRFTCSRLASNVAAARISRLRRPSSGFEYLLAMTSPCSVMRMAPCTAPTGWARIA